MCFSYSLVCFVCIFCRTFSLCSHLKIILKQYGKISSKYSREIWSGRNLTEGKVNKEFKFHYFKITSQLYYINIFLQFNLWKHEIDFPKTTFYSLHQSLKKDLIILNAMEFILTRLLSIQTEPVKKILIFFLFSIKNIKEHTEIDSFICYILN